MSGGELRALGPLALVTLLALMPQPALAGFTARTDATATFRAAASFGPPPAPPVNTVAPAVEGGLSPGSTLTASPGTWTGSPTAYAHAWRRCALTCLGLGESGSSHLVSAGDIGYALRYEVTATNAYGSASATATTAPVPPRLTAHGALTGLALTGSTATAGSASWEVNPALATTPRSVWMRCPTAAQAGCAEVAAGATYTATAADVGAYLRVRAEMTQNGVTGAAWNPAAIGPVAPLPPRLTATVTTNVSRATSAPLAADGSPSTVFSTVPIARAGEWVRLDFGAVRTLVAYEAAVAMTGPVFEVSADGVGWTAVATDDVAWSSEPAVAFTPPIAARYLRMRLVSDQSRGWWVNDIRVWGS